MNASLPSPDLKPHKLTVDELLAFTRSGAFDGLPRVELLEGTLYEMSPQTSSHFLAKNRLTFRLQSKIMELGLPYEALSEPTISVGATSAPEPDIIVGTIQSGEGFYPAASVLIAVEISVTTLSTDLNFKKALYAKALIPEYWVVEVEAGQIHQFWSPDGEDYGASSVLQFGAPLVSITLPGVSILTDGLT
jgi:Uma2 family endonuclease